MPPIQISPAMDRRRISISDEMPLALAVWFSSLRLVGVVAIPWRGWQAALTVAALLLVAALLFGWGACGWKRVTSHLEGSDER